MAFVLLCSGKERWTAMTRSGHDLETMYNAVTGKLGVQSDTTEVIYFMAPGMNLVVCAFSRQMVQLYYDT